MIDHNIITDQYKQELQRLQTENKFKGLLGKYDPINKFVQKYNPTSIIDYGCAHGRLIDQLKLDFPEIDIIEGYDPGVPRFENIKHSTYECLISNDVIEHVEPSMLDITLEKMEMLYTKSAWLIIACYPAKKFLSDGRNAHLTIETPEWWLKKISSLFKNSKIVWQSIEYVNNKPELRVVLEK